MTADERGDVPGIKVGRGDLILAGALVIDTVMEVGGFGACSRRPTPACARACSSRRCSAIRRSSVTCARRPCATSPRSFTPTSRTPTTSPGWSLELWDALAAADVHRGDPKERELLWATAMLHDIGTAVDYDDHHKHSRYLILSAGLPGFSPREVGLIGQAVRYHRKGTPGLGEFSSLAREGDEEVLTRIAASVRIAERLERSRDQAVRAFDLYVGRPGRAPAPRVRGRHDRPLGDRTQGDVFRKAFGRVLGVPSRPHPLGVL